MKLSTVQLSTFGGLNLDIQPLLAATDDNGRYYASTATNVSIDQITKEITKSKGCSSWADIRAFINTLSSNSNETVLRLMEYRYQSGRRVFIARTSGGFYKVNDGLTAVTAMNSVAALPNGVIGGNQGLQIPSWTQIGRHLVVVDGSGCYYWDGEASSFASARMMEPPMAWAFNNPRPLLELVSGASTLSLAKLHNVQITFYSATTGHSPPLPCGSIRTGSSSGTNNSIKVSTGYGCSATGTGDGLSGEGTGLAAPPVGSTHIYVWVQGHTATDELYYQYTTVAVNVGAVNTEITATLTTPAETTALPGFHGSPGGASIVCGHVGRAFYTGSPGWPVRLWYSEPGQPFVLNPTSWIDVGEFDDPIVSLVSFPQGSQLLGILKRHSVWSLSGFDDDSFLVGLQRVSDEAGCIAPHGVLRLETSAFFPGTGGFYHWEQGGKPVDISGPIRSYYLRHARGAA